MNLKEMTNAEISEALKEKADVCDAYFCNLLLKEAAARIDKLDRIETWCGKQLEDKVK